MPKILPQALDNTSLIRAKAFKMCLPCLLVQKMVVNFYGEIEITAVHLLCCSLDYHLSTVSIDSFYLTLKVVTKRLPFNTIKVSANKII